MRKRFIVGNWKSNKTIAEAKEWLEKFKLLNLQYSSEEKEVIVCPPFTLLSEMKKFIEENNLPIKLGVQNVSPFAEGAYTGEISAREATDYVTHALIGHSERRKYFHETNEDVLLKIKQLLENSITPVLCISDSKQLEFYVKEDDVLVKNADKIIFVYEPPSAISGGGAFHTVDSEEVNTNAAELEKIIGKAMITLYGGSLNPDNAAEIFKLDHIHGGLPGQASLDPETFLQIIMS